MTIRIGAPTRGATGALALLCVVSLSAGAAVTLRLVDQPIDAALYPLGLDRPGRDAAPLHPGVATHRLRLPGCTERRA